MVANLSTGAVLNSTIEGFMGTASGTDTITVNPSPMPLLAYTTNALLMVQAGGNNATTTPTININSLGAKTIVKRASTALAAGDIVSGMLMLLRYNGTNMQLLNPVVP